MTKRFFVLLLIAAFFQIQAQQPDNPIQKAVQKILDDGIASGRQTAAQVCVYIDGKLVVDAWAGTYERGGKKKIDGNSLFPVFSTEKPVFVTAAHILHDQGKLDYDKRVCDYWPEFGCKGKNKMTMRHLLSHRSGLSRGSFSGVLPREKIADWDYMIKVVANQPVDKKYPPGTRTKYLPQIYGWALGEPLCRITGLKINDLLRKLVLIPAGIEKDFYFSADDEAMSRIVTIYATPQSDGKSGKSVESMNTELMRRACVPSSYAVANARGIAKFYLSLTGQNGRKPLIKKETLDHATRLSWWDGEPLTEDELTGRKFRMIFGLGYALWGSKGQPIGEIFGQGGMGGSEGYMDRKKISSWLIPVPWIKTVRSNRYSMQSVFRRVTTKVLQKRFQKSTVLNNGTALPKEATTDFGWIAKKMKFGSLRLLPSAVTVENLLISDFREPPKDKL